MPTARHADGEYCWPGGRRRAASSAATTSASCPTANRGLRRDGHGSSARDARIHGAPLPEVSTASLTPARVAGHDARSAVSPWASSPICWCWTAICTSSVFVGGRETPGGRFSKTGRGDESTFHTPTTRKVAWVIYCLPLRRYLCPGGCGSRAIQTRFASATSPAQRADKDIGERSQGFCSPSRR